MNVLQTVLLEARFDPVVHHRFVFGARDAAPVLVPVVAAFVGDGDDLFQGVFHLQAVDLQIFLIGGGNEGPRIRIVAHVPVGVQQSAVLCGESAPGCHDQPRGE
jgi:hypothetical protein